MTVAVVSYWAPCAAPCGFGSSFHGFRHPGHRKASNACGGAAAAEAQKKRRCCGGGAGKDDATENRNGEASAVRDPCGKACGDECAKICGDACGGGVKAASGVKAPSGCRAARSVEVSENEEGALTVTLEVPGYKADDLEVRVDDGVLHITSRTPAGNNNQPSTSNAPPHQDAPAVHDGKEAEHQGTDDGTRVLLRERGHRPVQRSFKLPKGAAPNGEGITATLSAGVLSVTVPRPRQAARRVAITTLTRKASDAVEGSDTMDASVDDKNTADNTTKMMGDTQDTSKDINTEKEGGDTGTSS